jgi:hypothetical protein
LVIISLPATPVEEKINLNHILKENDMF